MNIFYTPTIYSKNPAYLVKSINDVGLEIVNHKYHFVDPESGVHTQTVERLWGSLKWRNKRERGTTRHLMESYFAEFAWRQAHKNDDLFTCIINAIATYWPPVINTLATSEFEFEVIVLTVSATSSSSGRFINYAPAN